MYFFKNVEIVACDCPGVEILPDLPEIGLRICYFRDFAGTLKPAFCAKVQRFSIRSGP